MGLGDDVLQDLLVAAVQVDGTEVVASVYGSTRNVCGTVRFTFAASDERAAVVERLERWAAAGRPVTLVRQGDQLTLVCERALLARATSRA